MPGQRPASLTVDWVSFVDQWYCRSEPPMYIQNTLWKTSIEHTPNIRICVIVCNCTAILICDYSWEPVLASSLLLISCNTYITELLISRTHMVPANCLRWKSFAVVETNFNSLENNRGCMVALCDQIPLHRSIITVSLEKFCSYWSIHENCKTFPPWTICNIWLIIAIILISWW